MYHLFFLVLLFSSDGLTLSSTTSPWTGSTAANNSSKCIEREGTSFTLLMDTYYRYWGYNYYISRIVNHLSERFPCVTRKYDFISLDTAATDEKIYTDKTDFTTNITNFPWDSNIYYKLYNCNQSTLYGLKRALEISPTGAFILVLTTGSMVDYTDAQLLSDVYNLLEKKQPQIYFLVNSYCSIYGPQQQIFNNITALTFGQFSYSTYQQLVDVELLLSKPLNSSVRILNISATVTGSQNGTFNISKTLSYLLITTNGAFTLNLTNPSGVITQFQKFQRNFHDQSYLVKNPATGNWLLQAFGTGSLTVNILGFTGSALSGICSESNCHPNATCEEFGGYRLQCTCKRGFAGNGSFCYDIDECQDYYDNVCSLYGYNKCENTIGSYNCSCVTGFLPTEWGCTDINECANTSLNNCHRSAVCTNGYGSYTCNCPYGYFGNGSYCEVNECQQGTPCTVNKDCIKYIGSYSCIDPCSNHTILNDPWRSTSNTYTFTGNYGYYYWYHCDSSLQGWYRFKGDTNQQIPDHCVSSYSCGTNMPMWLNGTYPNTMEGIVNRTACASWGKDCCKWSYNISVKTCPGGFYVYKLSGTPTCNMAYCIESNINCSGLVCASDEECRSVNGAFGCYCKNTTYAVSGWGSSNPADYLKPKLLCGLERIQLTFSKCLLEKLGYDTTTIHLTDNNCGAAIERTDKSYVSVITLPRSYYCSGSISATTTNVTYRNTVYLSFQSSGVERNEYPINFHCTYPINMEVSLLTAISPYTGSSTFDIEGTLNYTITMGLFQDSDYTIPLTGSYLSLSISTMLYVGAIVSGVTGSSQFVLVIKNCYATPTADKLNPIRYDIIKERCPNTVDPTINVVENGVSLKSRFSFQLFKFSGAFSQVYLHCQVGVCDTWSQQCYYSCPTMRTLKTANNTLNIDTKTVTLGPLKLKDSPSSGGDTIIPLAQLIFTVFVAFVLL